MSVWLDRAAPASSPRPGKRGSDRAADDLHGVIPRDDVAGDTVGFAQRIDRVAVHIGDRFASDFVSGSGVEFHVAGKGNGICAGLLERLAHIHGFDPCQLVRAFQNQLTDAGKDATALQSRGFSPIRIERSACGLNSAIYVIRRPPRNYSNVFAGGGVFDRQHVAGLHPCAVDKELVGRIPDFVKH